MERKPTGFWILVALGVAVLGVLVGLVERPLPRVTFAAIVMGFVTWSVHTSARRWSWGTKEAPQPRKERRNHALRHRVNTFLQNVRRLDAIARDALQQKVPRATGDRALDELEGRLHELIGQMREVAGRDSAPIPAAAIGAR